MTEPAHETPEVDTPVRPRRTLRRVLAWIGGILGALVLYAFGGPGGVTKEVRAEHAELVAAGKAPAVEDRFVIPIPGCTCHSDNPALIVEHAERRMRDCFGLCH